MKCPGGCEAGTLRLPDPLRDQPCPTCSGSGEVTEAEHRRYRRQARRRLEREGRRYFANRETA